jgi:energy-coupling factor transport system permease protein
MARRGMHQGAWLLWALGAATVAVSTTNLFYLVPLVAVCWFVYATRHEPGPAARSFRTFLVFAALAVVVRTVLVALGLVWPALGPVTGETVVAAALEGARLGALLIVFGTFNSVTDPFRLLGLVPGRFHEAALAASLALSIAPRTMEALGKVREAQRLRGIETKRWRMVPALAVPVLATGMEDAVTLAESMDARGHGRGHRSRYRTQRWDRNALAIAAAGASAGVAFVAMDLAGAGGLEPASFPLVWPDASAVLVAAVLLLALPGVVSERTSD